ncbi:hypothetical protein PIROE2DRAFT_39996 [Piromyces sp. E2]|nr:hypothetical protein PIROE2DRAFT_39996 [Piromyces sp. E2]|eukprot:OUM67504.1 hypothetical protein PIROE2DRAFT_39996 [Piromyces sp. E2]
MNRVCKILGIQKPVIQAPMTWITSPELVAAVSNAGGLGVLGPNGGFEQPVYTVEETVEEMRKTIRKTKKLTSKPFGMNVFPSQSDAHGFSKAIIQLCKEEGVKILACFRKPSPEEIRQWKEDSFTVMIREPTPTVRNAIEIEKNGADIIVVTGCDEGGFVPSNSMGTIAAVALISNAVTIPVIAAGGIVNEKMAKAAAIVGAEGAYVGSRFILSKECRAAQTIKEDIMNTHPDDLIIFSNQGGEAHWRATPHKTGKDALQANKNGDYNPSHGNYYLGIYKGDVDASITTVNNVISLVKSIDSSEDIVNEIAKGFDC